MWCVWCVCVVCVVCVCVVWLLQVFDKALDESNYSFMYAQLCLRLNDYGPLHSHTDEQQGGVRFVLCVCVCVCVCSCSLRQEDSCC